jgi:nucleotide-binding universal stress UspA family protein
MPVKHILLPVSGYGDASDACACTLELAKRLNAHVTAGCADLYSSVFSMGIDVPGPGYGALMEMATELADEMHVRARRSFDAAVAVAKVPIVSKPVCRQSSTEWLERDDLVSAYGRLTDLIATRIPLENAPSDHRIVEEALFAARRPTLLLTPGRKGVDFSRPVIAWNGTPEACHAALAVLPLLNEDAEIVVLQVGQLRHGSIPAERLLDSLGWRCFATRLHRVHDAPYRTGEIIQSEAKALGASILVMGAYSHSRTRELLLGGVTAHALGHGQLPMLFAH